MTLKEQVLAGLEAHLRPLKEVPAKCAVCPYNKDDEGHVRGYDDCRSKLYEDACALINEMQDVIDLLGAKE